MSSKNGRKNVVIVGGGAGGAITARTLSKSLDASKFNLILIDPRPNFILLPATVRLVVSKPEGIEDQVLIPLKDIFIKGKGTFIQEKVERIEKSSSGRGGHVVLSNNERVAFDALVLSPGSTWPSNFGFPDEPNQLRQYWADSRATIKAANNIVLVGGGAVGLELAGEIADTWPEKSVTIVQGDKNVLNKQYPIKFRKALEKALAARKINLVANDYLDSQEIAGGYVKTRNGKRLSADLVLTTRGPRPNTEFIAQSLGDDVLAANGSLNVEPTLQLPNHPEIFAVGDVVNWAEQKQLLKAQAHGAIVSANVISYLKGKSLKPYKGSPEVIVVMLGKTGGVGYMGFLGGFVMGDWFVRTMKSKSLMLGPLKGPYV